MARAYLASAARDAALELRELPDDELEVLFDEPFELPTLDLGMTITLPALLRPEMQRLFDAVEDDEPEVGEEVIPEILDRLDTPVERSRIARVILRLRDQRRIDSQLAAAATIDLASHSRSLMRACLIQTAFIHTGMAATPGGLRLAA